MVAIGGGFGVDVGVEEDVGCEELVGDVLVGDVLATAPPAAGVATVEGPLGPESEPDDPRVDLDGPRTLTDGPGDTAGVAEPQPAVIAVARQMMGIRPRTRLVSTARLSSLDRRSLTPSQGGNASTRATGVTYAKRGRRKTRSLIPSGNFRNPGVSRS